MSWAVELVIADGRFSRHLMVDDFTSLQEHLTGSRNTVVEVHAYQADPQEAAQALVQIKRDRGDMR